jgi:hypothetical protein
MGLEHMQGLADEYRGHKGRMLVQEGAKQSSDYVTDQNIIGNTVNSVGALKRK